jgi:6,7-dimethyl-8-ribityllumazine synthase
MLNSDNYTDDLSVFMPLIQKCKIGLVTANFNASVTHVLTQDIVKHLTLYGVQPSNIHAMYVPGALEIPFGLQQFIQRETFSSLIAVGAVIRGETYHFELVCNHSCSAIMSLSLNSSIPIVNGILTTENLQQIQERMHKAKNFAHAAISMALISQKQQ